MQYTTLVPFNGTDGFNYTEWERVGLSIIGNRLSVFINQVFGTTCTFYGGGFATIQVAVVEETTTVTSTATASTGSMKKRGGVVVETAGAQKGGRKRVFEGLIPAPTGGN